MKKTLMLLLGGVLLMSSLTGCSVITERKSKSEIREMLKDLPEIMTMDNFEELYDRRSEDYPSKKGNWLIGLSFTDPKAEFETLFLVIAFFGETRTTEGYLYVTYSDEDEARIPVVYENGSIKDGSGMFELDSTEAILIELDEETQMRAISRMNEILAVFKTLSFSNEYLEKLESKRSYYNFEVPMFGVDYDLKVDDPLVMEVLPLYPNIDLSQIKPVLYTEGNGDPWQTRSKNEAYFSFDENDKLTSHFRFDISFFDSVR